MKQLLSILLAGFLGGMIAYGAFSYKLDQQVAAATGMNQSPKAVFTNSPSNTPDNFVEAAALSTPAVVSISAKESDQLASQRMNDRKPVDIFDFDMSDIFGRNFFGPKQGTGSGVIYSEDGYIVTNNHVVGFADNIKVELTDGRTFTATKIGTDPSSDLALLKIEADNLPTMATGNSDDVKIGEWVLAVGNPFNYLTSTVTAGIVSAKGRDLDIIETDGKEIEEFIQTDAAVNPGNSGGALVDTKGNLIGINTAIATPNGVFAGYSFAIPINLVVRIIEDIKVNGNIERANLGIEGFDVDEELAQEESLNTTTGFFVVNVVDGSGAQYSGVLPRDVVIEVNNVPVNNIEDIKNEIKFSKVGDTVTLKVIREGNEKIVPVKMRKSF